MSSHAFYKKSRIKHCSEMHGYIYASICRVNNKVYIGMRHGCPVNRYFGSGKILHLAIKKYGISSFDNEVLEKCYSEQELRQSERDYIAYFRFIGVPLYNICPGGEGVGCGPDNPMFGKPMNSKTRSALILANTGKGRKRSCAQKEHAKRLGSELRATRKAYLAGQEKRKLRFPNWSLKIKESLAHIVGKKRIFSDEHKEALRLSWIKRKANALKDKKPCSL